MLKGNNTAFETDDYTGIQSTHKVKSNPVSIVLGGLVAVAIISGFYLFDSFVSAGTGLVDEINITIPVSCTLSGTGMNTHNANIANGTYTADVGATTLKAFCNDSEGFAIYATGYTENTIGETNSNKLVGASTNTTIETGTATTAGNPDVSNWAMKLSTDANATYPITLDNSFNAYHAVPNTYTKVAHRNSGTGIGASATGAELTTTYAAYVSKTQPADTYAGQVIYTLVHPASEEPLQPRAASPGCISYWPNAHGVVDTMGDDCGGSSSGGGYGNNVVLSSLWANNFQHPGYGFAGWSDKFDWVINENDINGNGTGVNEGYHIYGPNASFTTPSNILTKGLSLYAIWVPSSGDFQDFSCPNNSAMPIGTITALRDQRDDNVYTIAKLADGKCWMTENLRLDDTAAHNSDGSLAQGYNSSFVGLANPEDSNFNNADPPVANSLYSPSTSEGKIVIGTDNYSYARMPRYNNQNTANPVANMTIWDNSNNVYSVGNYYTWASSIADTNYHTNGTYSETSICPTGWHIPYGRDRTGNGGGNTAGGFYYLNYKINNNQSITNATASKKFRDYPNNFIYSGRFNGSSVILLGDSSWYWSSTGFNSDQTYYFFLYSSNASFNTSIGKYNGLSIRCVQ
ncbi:hypothetical protein IKD98_01770 [Candidatus Saccharibacteria bacterium]|nr:hypothetical protein [Candidatus Saccharibacteria bacterium]